MNRIKGILYAAVSSSTFGLAPFFSITLLLAGFSAFEVLSYRWGVASIVLIVFGWLSGCNFRLAGKDWGVVFLLSLLRAVTSFSLIIAYQNIASGVADSCSARRGWCIGVAGVDFGVDLGCIAPL